MAPGTPSTGMIRLHVALQGQEEWAVPRCLLCKGARWPSVSVAETLGVEDGDAEGTSSAAGATPCRCSLSAGKAGNSCSRDPPGIQRYLYLQKGGSMAETGV